MSHFLSLLFSPTTSLLDVARTHALLTVSGAAAAASARLATAALRLVSAASPAAAAAYALLLESRLPVASSLVCTEAIKLLIRRDRPLDALAFFCRRTHPANCRPSPCTFARILTSAKLAGSLNLGESLHSLALKLGFLSHLRVPNTLLHLYASCDALDLARQIFDEMPVRDRVSYNSMMDGFIQSADLDKARELLSEMPDRNEVSWSTVFNGYVQNRMFKQGMELFREIQAHRVDFNDAIIVTLLSVYSHFKLGLYGRIVHGFLLRSWLEIPTHVSSAIVNCYCKSNRLDEAVALFDKTPGKDLIVWNTLIAGLGAHGRSPEALDVFSKMLQSGVRPDDITFVSVLVACAHGGLVDEGLQNFSVMTLEFGIKPSFSHYWCLVDLFVRAGRPSDALKVIQGMPLDNQSSVWSGVIWLARVLGDTSVGEYIGKRLIELEPGNSRRYAPLVNLYAAASEWDKYGELQDAMKVRGLKKLPGCMLIDLNVVAHKFSFGDKTQHEIEKIYKALEEIADQLKLQPRGDVEE